VFHAKLVLRDGTHGASLLAWYWNVYDGVVGTSGVALATTDAYLIVNLSL
jgi:hypothetical protein